MATQTSNEILPARYTSVETLAHGGMGEIYKACDDALGRNVAIKVLAERYARDEPLRNRFTREALAAARLSGEPFTVAIYDVGEWNDRPYIVMELAAGGTVAERMDDAQHDTADALRWLAQAAQALDAAHARGVVHRDVKPANLLLTRDGDVRVADFGIASAAGLTSMTAPGTVLGTLGYLAPEQAMGESVGPAADRYSLAVVAYELLAGRRPYERDNGAAEAAAAAREAVPPISQVGDGLPPALDAVFERALARDPAQRYASCSDFVADVRAALEAATAKTEPAPAPAPALAPPPPLAPPIAVSRTRASWLPWAVLAALLAAGGVLAAVLLAGGGEDKRGTARTPAVRTVTARGETVTVTAPAPPAPAPTTTAAAEQPTTTAATPATTAPAASAPSGASGAQLNDAGWQRMKAGDYAGALPVLEQAVAKLSGTGSITEAYALYNLAFTRFALGDCTGVLSMLDQSEAIQGHRVEIDDLRAKADDRCG